MKRQQGQSMVEFALIAPILFLMIFGMVWGGFMFMEYLHFSNQVRTVARQIAVADNSKRTEATFVNTYKTEVENLYTEYNMPKIYHPSVQIGSAIDTTTTDGKTERIFKPFTEKSTEVIVEVSFEIEDDVYNSLPNILKNPDDVSYGVGFPPKSIKAIQYHMRLEGVEDDDSETEKTEGT